MQGRMHTPLHTGKPSTGYFFRNTRKIIFDVGKTMSYAGKIMSDVIQIISDLFCRLQTSEKHSNAFLRFLALNEVLIQSRTK